MKLPTFDPYPTISNDRVLLRQILRSDIENILAISFYDFKQETTVDEAIVMQEKINQNFRDGNSIHWGIVDRTTNKLVGTCGYYRRFNKGDGELGCILLPQFRGQGFMVNAMRLAVDFGLRDLGLKRIWAIASKRKYQSNKIT